MKNGSVIKIHSGPALSSSRLRGHTGRHLQSSPEGKAEVSTQKKEMTSWMIQTIVSGFRDMASVSPVKWEALGGFYGTVVINLACTLESSGSLLKLVTTRSHSRSIRSENLRMEYGYHVLISTFLG